MKNGVNESNLAVGAAVVSAGGQSSQITQMLKQVESRHADGLGLQLRHLRHRETEAGDERDSFSRHTAQQVEKSSNLLQEQMFIGLHAHGVLVFTADLI